MPKHRATFSRKGRRNTHDGVIIIVIPAKAGSVMVGSSF
jgi:hypothetical protein